MQAFLLAGFVTLATAALPDKAMLKSIFIDGSGTKAPNILTQAQIDSIDRELTMEFDYPAFTMGSAMPSPFNDTCGQSAISCPAYKFNVMPGMDVSTIGVRDYAMTSASGYMTAVGPTITFDMTVGKKYTFLMVDGFSGADFWSAGSMAPVKQQLHYSVLNIDQSSGLGRVRELNLKTAYRAPGNQVVATPNIYAFMVWEHTEDATQPGPSVATNSAKGLFSVQKWIQNASANAQLVAMNYFKAYGNVYSRADLLSGSSAMFAMKNCTAAGFSSADKMCMPLTGTTDGTATTGAATTGVGATISGGSVTSPELSLIFGIAVAITIARQ